MEYHLDRQIRFEAEPKFKGLYKWALQEVDKDGKQGRDQIPWDMSHYFDAIDLLVMESYAVKSKYEASRTWVRATLRPQSGRRYRNPSYSMFGTDREISSIHLFIHPIDSEETENESVARASGFVAYTFEDPISGNSQPDHLQFDMNVPREEFDSIAGKITANKIGAATFRCHASGFYSDWTPDIEADEFKVLTSHEKEQAVEVPDGVDITPPRLGKVWDASFAIQMAAVPSGVATQERNDDDDEDDDFEDTQRPLDPVERARSESRAMYVAVHRELRTIKTLIGLLAVIAALILIFR